MCGRGKWTWVVDHSIISVTEIILTINANLFTDYYLIFKYCYTRHNHHNIFCKQILSSYFARCIRFWNVRNAVVYTEGALKFGKGLGLIWPQRNNSIL